MSTPLIFTVDGPINVTREMFDAALKDRDLTEKPVSEVCNVLEGVDPKKPVYCFAGSRDQFFAKYAQPAQEEPSEPQPQAPSPKPDAPRIGIRYYYQIHQGETILEIGEVAGMRNRWGFLDLSKKTA